MFSDGYRLGALAGFLDQYADRDECGPGDGTRAGEVGDPLRALADQVRDDAVRGGYPDQAQAEQDQLRPARLAALVRGYQHDDHHREDHVGCWISDRDRERQRGTGIRAYRGAERGRPGDVEQRADHDQPVEREYPRGPAPEYAGRPLLRQHEKRGEREDRQREVADVGDGRAA